MVNWFRMAPCLTCVVAIGVPIGAHADVDPKTGRIGGDAAAQSFAEYCRGELPAERESRFYAELDDAEQALDAGDLAMAETALGGAWQAAFRGGGETDVGVRCLGEQATRRWFQARLELWRRGSSAGARGGMGADYTTLYAVAADHGSKGIVEVVSKRPADRFTWAYHSVEDIVEVDEWARAYGTLILPEEQAIANAAREALPALREYAKREHAATLVAEADAFDRPATQMERDATAQLDSIGQLAESMGGIDISTADRQAALVTRRQVDESRALLEKARGLELEAVFGYSSDRSPSDLRAKQRGDILFERGNDESLTLEYRDQLYELSNRYYAWCNCHDERAVVAAAKESIQPALQARREEQQRKAESMQADMQQKAESMQQAVDDMQKTEAEKQSFKDEADALEAELDF